jgi:hypothetical protein
MGQALQDLKFDLKDCTIEVARHSTKNRPIRFGIFNGEIDYADHPEEDPEKIASKVTVTHIPTGLSVSVDKFHPSRNRAVAIELLKEEVTQYINKMIEHHEKKNV